MASLLNQLDQQLEQIISNWNLYSTILSIVLVSYLIYPLFSSTEPDTHPFLLARQATASRVRQPGETAIYRSPDRPYGYPLCSGLNVKSPGAPKWSSGKDGDLRDVWRQATAGQPGSSEQASKQVGKVYTLLGKEDTIEHSFEKLSAELNAIGKHLKARQSASVAIYLSNSPELLVVLFGMTASVLSMSSFYQLTRNSHTVLRLEADTHCSGAVSRSTVDHSQENGSRFADRWGWISASQGPLQEIRRTERSGLGGAKVEPTSRLERSAGR